MMCLYFFVDSCCNSHNNELHYVIGFNKGVGSLKMWLHLYFALSLLWFVDLKPMLVIGDLGQFPTIAWCLTL